MQDEQRSRLSVIVENFQFIGGRDQTDTHNDKPHREPRRPAKASAAHYKDADIPSDWQLSGPVPR
jgi:hypothetical protein